MMAKTGWSKPFEDPVVLADGRKLITLKDAADYVMKLPKAEQKHEKWEAAIEALIMAAEDRGPATPCADRHAARPEPQRRARVQRP